MNNTTQNDRQFTLGEDPRIKPSFIKNFLFFISLRHAGNNLLTSGAKGYLIAMSVVMFLVATAEAVAWGYFGAAFIPAQPLLSGLAVGSFVFFLIWFFDRILMTSDFMEREHRMRLSGEANTPNDDRLKRNENYKIWGFFSMRLVVALVSLWIAAPYVTQLVFSADIQNKQQEYFQQTVNQVKQNYQAEHQAILNTLITKIDQSNQKLQTEIAGGKNSLSGRYGRGVSAIAIEQELNSLKEQYQQVSTESKQHIQRIEQALKTSNYRELTALDIRVDKDSPIIRRKAIKDLKLQYPAEFSQVEHAVQGLLIILAVILFALKFMQFNAVRLYFSSNLQSKWNLYCLGRYDAFLLESERRHVLLNSQDALPEEFEQMMIAVASKKNQHEKMEMEERLRTEQTEKEKRLQAHATHAAFLAKEQKSQAKHEAEINAEQGHYERLAKEKATIEKRERDRNLFEAQIDESLQQVKQIEEEYLQKHGTTITQLETDERQLIDELHELEKQFKTQQDRIDARLQRIEESEIDIKNTETLLNNIRQSENRDRIETLRTIGDYETSLMSQKDRIRGQRGELLGFQSNQKFYEENSQLSRQRLQEIQLQLGRLKQPLHKIDEARASVETRRIQFVMDQGLMESPFQKPVEEELPYLVGKLRDQMMTVLPTL